MAWLLMNFNVMLVKDGIKRLVWSPETDSKRPLF
jgi:hypothetical protein